MTGATTKICGAFCGFCGAAEDGCATTPRKGVILWRTPTVRSRFVAQFVAQDLWRNSPCRLTAISLPVPKSCEVCPHTAPDA